MKRALAWIACLMLLAAPLMATEQPAGGDMAFGPRYSYFSTDSDLGDREVLYGVEWEGWLNDRLSFGLAAFRPREISSFSGDFFLALHHKAFFFQGNLGYMNEPDDTGTAGVGLGLSLMPHKHLRLKLQARADYVLGDLELVKDSVSGSSVATESCSNSNASWCTDETEIPLIVDTESVEIVYRVEGGLAWVW